MSFVDVDLPWFGDWSLDGNSDIVLTQGLPRVTQFIERRVLTTPRINPIINLKSVPDYLFDVKYGIGAGALVDQPMTGQLKSTTQQVVLQGIKMEPGVAPFPSPTIGLITTPGGQFNILATFFVPPLGMGKVGFTTSGG